MNSDFTPLSTVNEPRASCSEAFLAVCQSGSTPKAANEDFAVRFRFFGCLLPFRIGAESFPGTVTRFLRREGQHINELVLFVVHRRPIADVFHTMLLE